MARPVLDALASVLDASSNVGVGWTLTFQSLAGAAQEVYTDTGLGTPASTAGVLTANASGRFSQAFFNPALDYKVILKNAGGSTVATINPVHTADGFLDSSDLTPYLAKAGGTMTGPLNEAEGSSVASATSINADSATGNFFHVTGTTQIDTITLAQGASRTVVFDGALQLTHSSNLLLGGSNITTHANMVLMFRGEGGGVTRLVGGMTAMGRPVTESAEILVKMGDETTAITASAGKISFLMPFTMYLDALPTVFLTTAQNSGTALTVDVNAGGSTIFSTRPTVDNAETSSDQATTPAVLSVTTLSAGSRISVDVDAVDGSTSAAGLGLILRGYRRSA